MSKWRDVIVSKMGVRAWGLVGIILIVSASILIGLSLNQYDGEEFRPKVSQFIAIRHSLLRNATGADFIDISSLFATPQYFKVIQRAPEKMGLDAEKNHIFFAFLDIHFWSLPEPSWTDKAVLRVNGERKYFPGSKAHILADSFHHQTIAFQFPRMDSHGNPIIDKNTRFVELIFPEELAMSGLDVCCKKVVRWELPLPHIDTPNSGHMGHMSPGGFNSSRWGGIIALMAGLLIPLSPCLLHLATGFFPLIAGIGAKEVTCQRDNFKLQLRVISSTILFVIGFSIVYTIAGALAGYTGHTLQKSPIFSPYVWPLTMIAGIVIIYLGVQVSGLVPVPFRLSIPLHIGLRMKDKEGLVGSFLMGLSFAAGCLMCVSGSMLAAMLLYSGAIGSPSQGALTLFLLSMGMGIPYVLIALTFGRMVPKARNMTKLVRSVSIISGLLLVTLGVLMVSDNAHLIEDLVIKRIFPHSH